MKGFIEVHINSVKRLLNVRQIEMVKEITDGSCIVYFAFNIPYPAVQDSISPDESYDEIKRRIEEATI